jgi:GPH family glycoside/pentoside/hexuronide:cation symporter
MSHHSTRKEDRIPLLGKIVYGLGAFVNNLLAAAIGGMVIVLNLGLGMNPALVGLLSALPRLTDALTDPVMGYISDNTHSRWGRRRPYIFIGAIASGLIFILLWQLPDQKSELFYFWYFLIGSIVFYLAYTMFATPWVALGYELTPDYHERTRLMGVQNFIGQLAYIVSPWFLLVIQNQQLFDNMVDGAAGLSVLIAAVVVLIGILPAIFLKERIRPDLSSQIKTTESTGADSISASIKHNLAEFFRGFGATLSVRPFLKLCVATFLVFNGFMMVSSFQFYVIIYYVFSGDTVEGARYAGYSGTLGAFCTFFVITLVTWLATHIGKRHAFFLAIGISMLGYILKWFCYNPDYPWLLLLPTPLIAFGLGGLFTLVPSMMADVVDFDETLSGLRREGMFGAIFWWVVKLGMAAALALGGLLLNSTGFDVALGGLQSVSTITSMRIFDAAIPAICSGLAIWIIASYTLTEDRSYEIRAELERKRQIRKKNIST